MSIALGGRRQGLAQTSSYFAHSRGLKGGRKSHSWFPPHFVASGMPPPLPHPGKKSLTGHHSPIWPPLGVSSQYGPPLHAQFYACAWWGGWSVDPGSLKRTSPPPNHTCPYLSRDPSHCSSWLTAHILSTPSPDTALIWAGKVACSAPPGTAPQESGGELKERVNPVA